MNEHWYRRAHDGEVHGQLSLADLKRLDAEGKLGEGDFLRRGEAGEWRPAREALARLGRMDATHGSASDAAARTIADADRAALRRMLSGEEEDAPSGSAVRSGVLQVKAAVEFIRERLGALLGFGLDRVFSPSGRIATLVVVLAVLATLILRFTGFSDTSIGDAHAEYMSLWGEIRELRARSASEEDWQAFERNARGRLAPLIARLEETQSSNPTNKSYWLASNQVRANLRNELIAAGKSDLPAVLHGGRNEESPIETRLGRKMQRVALYLDGKDPYPASKKKQSVAKAKSKAEPDYASAGIVAVDALLVAGGVVWWIKRRRK